MKPIIYIAAAALLLAGPAFASSADCNGVGNCSEDNSIHNSATGGNGGAGGAGGAGGNGSAAASATAGGGSATTGPVTNVITTGGNTQKIEKGAVDVDNDIHNSNSLHSSISNRSSNKNSNKNSQHQSQSQEAYSSSDSNVSDAGNSSIVYQRNVATANAAAAIVAACGDKTVGAAAQGPGFGGSLSLPFGSNCKDLAVAAFIQNLGHPEAALRYLCRENDDVAEDKELCAPKSAVHASLMDGYEAGRQAAFEPMQPVK